MYLPTSKESVCLCVCMWSINNKGVCEAISVIDTESEFIDWNVPLLLMFEWEYRRQDVLFVPIFSTVIRDAGSLD